MITTYKGSQRKDCKIVTATKLYNTHRGASLRTYGLRKPDSPKNEQDFVVLSQGQTRRLIKQLQTAIKK